jgi:hypothetical protein
MRHFAYASGWKKFEPLWDVVIRAKQAGAMLPVLEGILSEFGRRAPSGRASSNPLHHETASANRALHAAARSFRT